MNSCPAYGGIYASGVMHTKEIELLSIALDASFAHMYAPGTWQHIHNALKGRSDGVRSNGSAEALCKPGRRGAEHGYYFDPS